MVNYAYIHFFSHVNTIMWHCCVYNKNGTADSRPTRKQETIHYIVSLLLFACASDGSPPFRLIVYAGYGEDAIASYAYRSPPCGGGAGGGAFYFLLSPEIGRHFAPLARLPLHQMVLYLMRAEPCLGASDYLIEGFGLLCALQFGLALSLLNPQYGVVRVGVDGLACNALAVEQCKRVYNGEEFAYVVGAVHRTEVEHLRSGGKVDGLIFHRTRIARACCVHRPGVCRHLHGQRQHRIVAVVGRIECIHKATLHALRYLNTQQCHAVLQRLANVLSQYQTYDLLVLGVGTQD